MQRGLGTQTNAKGIGGCTGGLKDQTKGTQRKGLKRFSLTSEMLSFKNLFSMRSNMVTSNLKNAVFQERKPLLNEV